MKRRTFVGVAGAGVLGVAGCTHARTEPEADGTEDDPTASERSGAETSGANDGDDGDDENGGEDAAPETIAVGELVGDELEFVVSDVDRRRSFMGLVREDDGSALGDDERRQASADAAFVVVAFAIRNAGDEFVSTADVLEPVLEDDAERAHSRVRSVSERALADGDRYEGSIAYHVERDREELYWLLEPPSWTDKEFWRIR